MTHNKDILDGIPFGVWADLWANEQEAKETGCTCGQVDENGACETNCHGYGPNPVFSWDELEEGDACDARGCGPID